jgi:hypothetical protein
VKFIGFGRILSGFVTILAFILLSILASALNNRGFVKIDPLFEASGYLRNTKRLNRTASRVKALQSEVTPTQGHPRMKIETNVTQALLLRLQSEAQAKSRTNEAGEDFSSLLGQAASSLSQPEAGKAPSSLDSSASLLMGGLAGQLQTVQAQNANMVPLADPGLEMDETLSLLEEYAKALGDPSKTLKDIAPLAEVLSQRAERLDSLSQSLSQDDPLRGIASETAVLASVEALKFKRGDFIE